MVKPAKPVTADRIPKTAQKSSEQIPLSRSSLGKARADFRTEQFRRVIQQKGYHLRWRKALLCTCFNTETDQPTLDCDVCDQSGFFYVEPLEIQGIMTNLEKQKNIYRHIGEWLEGSSMLTVEPEHRLGYRDSVEMIHSVMSFNEYIVKGNRRASRSKLPDGHDSARYRIVRVLHLLYDVDGKPVAVEEGVHFEVTKDGWIRWRGVGTTIPDGTVFSINYEFRPVWIVTNHPHAVRDTVTDFKDPQPTAKAMPIQAAVKLDYLLDVSVPLLSTE